MSTLTSADEYQVQLRNSVLTDVLERAFFDTVVAEPREPGMSRGVQVFANFQQFIAEQQAADGCAALYVAYCEQLRAFAMDYRDPTKLVRSFGPRSEDVRWMTRLVYDTKKTEIERWRHADRMMAIAAAATVTATAQARLRKNNNTKPSKYKQIP